LSSVGAIESSVGCERAYGARSRLSEDKIRVTPPENLADLRFSACRPRNERRDAALVRPVRIALAAHRLCWNQGRLLFALYTRETKPFSFV
jgi:hypothetical protein